jgi:hypothetical protein
VGEADAYEAILGSLVLWSPPAAADLPPVGLCAMTPVMPPRTIPAADRAAGAAILILGTRGDPTTPITEARRASERLEGATLLELDADHHLAYAVAVRDPVRPSYRCVLDAVADYLLELEPPRRGTVCSDRHRPGT